MFWKLLPLAALAVKSFVVCDAAYSGIVHVRATLDTANGHLTFVDYVNDLVTSGQSVYTASDGRKYYHLQFSFGEQAIQLLNDGEAWWLCVAAAAECHRCNL